MLRGWRGGERSRIWGFLVLMEDTNGSFTIPSSQHSYHLARDATTFMNPNQADPKCLGTSLWQQGWQTRVNAFLKMTTRLVR